MKKLSLAVAISAVALSVFAQEKQFFTTLPMCRYIDGKGEVLKPGQKDWVRLEEQAYYPLGSTFRATPGSKVGISLGRDSLVKIEDGASFGTVYQPLGGKTRTLVLKGGLVSIKVPSVMPAGALSVTSEGFTVKNIAGEVKLSYEEMNGDGSKAVLRCVTGAMEVEGRHFLVKDMHAADEVVVRTSKDLLFTELKDTSGDYQIVLDQGVTLQTDVETGDSVEVAKNLEWKMSPKNSVNIFRAVPEVGEKLSVAIMTFDAAGNMMNRCAFTEKTALVNSGELVRGEAKGIDEEAAKLAADVTEEEDADIEDDEDSASSSSESSSDSSDDGSDSSDDSSDSDDSGDDADFDF